MQRSTVENIKSILVSDRVTYKGSELPSILTAISELNELLVEASEETTEPPDG